MSPTRATTIVVTYESAGQIAEALTALTARTARSADPADEPDDDGAPIDVVVVDNASRDATAAIVREQFPGVTLLVNARNVGFAAAVNQGVAEVADRADPAPVVLLVNPDCIVPRATTLGLLDLLDADPSVGIVGPQLVGGDGRVAVSAHPFESLTSVVASRFGGSLVPVAVRRVCCGVRRRAAYDACRSGSSPTSVDWVSGACLAVRTDLLRTVGGLDERYFMYYEDEALCWEARRREWTVVYAPNLSATHVGGASSAVGATWPHLYRSMLVFFACYRSSSFAAVRGVVLTRSVVGLATATMRRLTGGAGGEARQRAWREIARIAWSARRDDLRTPADTDRSSVRDAASARTTDQSVGAAA